MQGSGFWGLGFREESTVSCRVSVQTQGMGKGLGFQFTEARVSGLQDCCSASSGFIANPINPESKP